MAFHQPKYPILSVFWQKIYNYPAISEKFVINLFIMRTWYFLGLELTENLEIFDTWLTLIWSFINTENWKIFLLICFLWSEKLRSSPTVVFLRYYATLKWEKLNHCSTKLMHFCKKLPLALDCRQHRYSL